MEEKRITAQILYLRDHTDLQKLHQFLKKKLILAKILNINIAIKRGHHNIMNINIFLLVSISKSLTTEIPPDINKLYPAESLFFVRFRHLYGFYKCRNLNYD